ncbi:MAG: T9SS type A sorting domain-containing protein, partial [Flavobacteriales bacterium]
ILAFPPSSETQTVPLLVSTQEAGNYTFKANTVENFSGYQVTFNDVLTNTSIALFQGTVIERYLDEGEYENRFYLNFSPSTVTGLANSAERTFTAYVANDLLNINVNNLDAFDAKIELMDASGRIVYSSTNQPINNGKYTVSLAGLASGVYVVQISTETWTNAQRFIYR